MKNSTDYFDNKFDSEAITPQRLCDFGADTAARLTADNPGGIFTTLIAAINTDTDVLQDEINKVDTGVNQQKGATQTGVTVLSNFKAAMSEEEPFIARALGGAQTEAYMEFYPHKISEYTTAGKENMNTLTDRVFQAATAHAALLGTALTNKLTAFQGAWRTADDNQDEKSSTVSAHRGFRSNKRETLEKTLMKAMGFVTFTFPADADKCRQFFDFSLLNSAHHQKVFNLTLAADTNGTILQHHFAANAQIKVTMLSDANIELYLTDTEDVPQNIPQNVAGNAEVILNIEAFQAPLATARFLFIKNASVTTAAIIKVELL